MRKLYNKATLLFCAVGLSISAIAGNKDRSGQAGATELLINPWGQSTGVFGLNTANVKGIDALKTNVAGLSMVNKTELGFAHSMYLSGSKVGINNLGFAQRIGDIGVLGVNIMAMSFDEITVTDYNNPEGGIGTFTPQFFNFNLAYSKAFSESIHAGVGATFVSEQISNVKASGAVFEAGIQYVTGDRNNFHLGITLRNVGTGMKFTGSGFSINSQAPEDQSYSLNRSIPSEQFEMPTYLNFGIAYDFYLDENRVNPEDAQSSEAYEPKHRLTALGSFTSNSFNNDYFGVGVEYGFQELFMVRAGYRHERKIGDAAESTTFYTGFSAGATVEYQLGETGPKFGLDYSYRPTRRPNNGVHTISLRIIR